MGRFDFFSRLSSFSAIIPSGYNWGMSDVPLKTTLARLLACMMIGLGPMIIFAESTSHIGNETIRYLGLGITALGFIIIGLNPREPPVNPPAPPASRPPESK